MKHLLLDSAPALGETWEALLQRFAEEVQQANTASVLIDALTTPHISNPLGQEPVRYQNPHKSRCIADNSRLNNTVQPESVDLPHLNFNRSNPGNRLDASGFTVIGPLSCRDCGGEFYFTAGEQAFYKSKNFDDQPKKCKQCRQLGKASSPPSTSTSPPAQTGGWDSSGTDGAAAPATPNAKDLWASSGRTWPPKPGDLPKGTPNQK